MKIKFLNGIEREFEFDGLHGADLRGADLRDANLRGADLRGASFAPTQILLANWGLLSDSLTADLMELDASAHPDRSAFDRWFGGGACPYKNSNISRAVCFQEERKLWGKGKLPTIYEAMTRLFEEKDIKF